MPEALNGWLEATIAGFGSMAASDTANAASHWLTARGALQVAAHNDPRRAASQTNAGAAHVLLRQSCDADAMLADAERLWTQLLGFTASADVSVPGRSSAFHFRLASTNLEAFQNVQRRRLARLCEAGLTITRFNRLLASAGPSACGAVAASVASQLADFLGPHTPEVHLLSTALQPSSETSAADSIYADKVAALEAKRAAMSEPAADEAGLLEAAVALTVLLPPNFGVASESTQASSEIRPVKSSSTR